MPLLLIAVAGFAAYAVYDTGLTGLFVVAVVNTGLSFWSNGVLANFGRHEARDAPNWAASISIITTVAAVGLIIYGYAT